MEAEHRPVAVRLADGGSRPLDSLRGLPVVAFAGIAKPWKVERALDAAGAELVDFAPFPDHAAFREDDLRFLADRAKRAHARLVTTEKDWFRLPPEWRTRVLSWPVKATFEDEAAFQRLLLSSLSHWERA
jgi:tetraacyldisaccharide 4'-kinase